MKAQHFSQSNCHQRVPVKVKIQLKGIGVYRHPRQRNGYTLITDHLSLPKQSSNLIRQNNLKPQSKYKQSCPLQEGSHIAGSLSHRF